MPLGTKVGLSPGHIVLHGDPVPPPKRGTASPQFSAHVSCCQTGAHLSYWRALVRIHNPPMNVSVRLTRIACGAV